VFGGLVDVPLVCGSLCKAKRYPWLEHLFPFPNLLLELLYLIKVACQRPAVNRQTRRHMKVKECLELL